MLKRDAAIHPKCFMLPLFIFCNILPLYEDDTIVIGWGEESEVVLHSDVEVGKTVAA